MKTTLASSLAVLAALAATFSARAGEMTAPAGKTPLPPAPSEKGWWITSTAYGWLTDVSGDVGIRGYKVPVDVGLDDILDNLDFAYMGYTEVGYKKWSLGLDVIYAKLSDDSTFAVGPLSGDASVEQEQALVTTRLQYRAVDNGTLKLDVFTGFRWNYYDVDLHVNTNAGDIQRSGNEDWFDLIVGARAVAQLGGNWFFHSMGDIGGFGAESDLTWQAVAGIGYQFSPSVSAVVGYRAMGVDYDKGGFLIDTVSHGPALGLSFTF